MSETLITKYRPTKLSEVIGQPAIVRSLEGALKKGTSKTFLFSGPPGVGKTTLARIAADLVGASKNLIEIDAATNTGIDDMRSVVAGLMYQPLGGGKKAVIVDEIHAASKSAVTSLLKILEEPPDFVYWFLCTTEPARMPEALRTRSTHYSLKPVGFEELAALLDKVVEAEGLRVGSDIVDICAKEAGGSPRQALANLSACAEAQTLAEAKELLRSAAIASEEAVNLARALLKGCSWSEAQKILTGLQGTNPESVRHVIRAYVSKVALTAKAEASAGRALEILDAFSVPFNSADGMSPVILATGKVLLGGST